MERMQDHMVEDRPPSELYWTGGRFNACIVCWVRRQQQEIDQAVKILDEFRSACQKQYITFQPGLNGRRMAYEYLSGAIRPEIRSGTLSVGTVLPDATPQPGQSLVANIPIQDLLEGLKEGGDFDNQHAKAVIVFIYHIWEGYYRGRIAESLRVKTANVSCDLLGDLREIRNSIIHNNSIIEGKTLEKLSFLPGIWRVELGELVITSIMLHSLMEQLNAIRVEVTA